MAAELRETAKGETDLAVAVDHDDPSLPEYRRLVERADLAALWYEGERKTLVDWVNRVALENCDRYRHLGFFGDDHVPQTTGWDTMLMHAISEMGGTGMAYGDDLRRRDIPEGIVMSSDIVRALGWMMPPFLRHFCVDDAWAMLGKKAECIRFCPDVVMEHMHYQRRPDVERDQTYQELEAGDPNAWAPFMRWRLAGMRKDVARIVALKAERSGE